MRATLLVLLVALLVTALTVTFTRSPARTLTAAPPHGQHDPVRVDTPSTTIPPAPAAGTGARAQAGGGCGLSLRGQVSPPAARTSPPEASTAPVGRCTVLEIGDSLGNDLGWGLARHVAPTSGLNLVQLDKSASGLSNSGFYDWPAQLAADLQQYHPQLVIVCLGGDDEQGIKVNGTAVQFPTPPWKTAYLARVRQVVSEATASGAYLLWIGLPIMQQPSYSRGVQTLNALYQEGVTPDPNAAFLSTWSLFSNTQGVFQSNAVVNSTQTTLRQSDGIHYSLAGEDVIATYVIRQIASIYHVQLEPTNPAAITSWT